MSVDCIYAIVKGLKSGKVITATELSMSIGYSTSAIESGIRPLSRSKLVMGLKGKGGGYRLVKPFEEITMKEFIDCVKSPNRFQQKLLDKVNITLLKDL